MAGAVLALASAWGTTDARAQTPEDGVWRDTAVREIDFSIDESATLTATRATAWRQGGVDFLLLEGNVVFETSGYGFRASRAVVRIDPVQHPEEPELRIRHLSVYLDEAQSFGQVLVTAEAPRLLVTAATTGPIFLEADAREDVAEAPRDRLVNDAAERVSRHFQPRTELDRAWPPRIRAPRAVLSETDVPRPDPPVVDPSRQSVLPTDGSLVFHAEQIVYEPGDEENVVVLTGGVRLSYIDRTERRTVVLRSERAVLFVDSAADSVGTEVPAGEVKGVYLEGAVVVTDGDYTVRCPVAYYDLATDQAVLLQTVVYAWDARRRLPLYVRAEEVRQTARHRYEAYDARLTTSEFAVPHFAIGARRVTVQETLRPANPFDPEAGQVPVRRFRAEGTTLRWVNMPVFGWPAMSGNDRDIPLRRVRLGQTDDTGVEIQTRWDFFALIGQEAPPGVDFELLVDWIGEHQLGVGADLAYRLGDIRGTFDGYLVPEEQGIDDIGGRLDIDRHEETRGFLRLIHQQTLNEGLTLTVQGAYVSDPTFLEEYFRDLAIEARPYENSIYLKQQEDHWAAAVLGAYDFLDFPPQLTTLQAPGYTVDKLPELSFFSIALPLFDERVIYHTENRISQVRINVSDETPADFGFNNFASRALFGINNTTPFEDAIQPGFVPPAGFTPTLGTGLPTDIVGRVDSRHELSLPLIFGAINLTPYLAGRVTAYDDDFVIFTGGEDDQVRLWGQVGVRASTRFVGQASSFQNRLLDVQQLRHIIEPSATLFATGSTYDQNQLPVFDTDVEGINDVSGARIGVRNTWQTRRGGPGRSRSVDWIVLDTDLILTDGEAVLTLPLARFFDYRPEFGLGGSHAHAELRWLVTDTLGLNGELTYLLEDEPASRDLAHWRVGATLQHTPNLTSFLNYQELDILDEQLLTYGFNYQLTRKYRIDFTHRLDFSRNESRRFSVGLTRQLPRWTMRIEATVDELDDDTTLGIVLRPDGIGGGRGVSFLRGD